MKKNITVEKINAIYENGFKSTCDLREKPCDKCVQRAYLDGFPQKLKEEFISNPEEKDFNDRLKELKTLEKIMQEASFHEKVIEMTKRAIFRRFSTDFRIALEKQYAGM